MASEIERACAGREVGQWIESLIDKSDASPGFMEGFTVGVQFCVTFMEVAAATRETSASGKRPRRSGRAQPVAEATTASA